jgi:hypothetical protein
MLSCRQVANVQLKAGTPAAVVHITGQWSRWINEPRFQRCLNESGWSSRYRMARMGVQVSKHYGPWEPLIADAIRWPDASS